MIDHLTVARIRAAYDRVRADLLSERNERGHWTGKLSTSALSTATAVMALEQVLRHSSRITHYSSLINGGLAWLVAHQNDDGGWGDTTKSFSNISTTMLCHAVFEATRDRWSQCATAVSAVANGDTDPDASTADTAVAREYETVVKRAKAYVDAAGGVSAVVARYGKDKTFSVPILTHCALAGLVDWREVQQLPFELACLPPRFYKTVRLPVVSYALPALIAIGQVRHHFRPTHVPGLRWLRNRARRKSLDVLQRIQPSNGGFLEAAPLTSFVTMSLAGMGLVEHPVVKKGIEFLVDSVRDDGSWPIDTNLATWVTTLSVNALGPDLPDEAREPILRWLLDQQYKEVHPFTNADPGGWSWTDLPGGVPDADDTPGAILAILELVGDQLPNPPERQLAPTVREGRNVDPSSSPSLTVGASDRTPLPDDLVRNAHEAIRLAVRWLLDLQNRDGGWPTFCRGWGKLPFDRSSPDITAHVLRALIPFLGGPDIVSDMLDVHAHAFEDVPDSLVSKRQTADAFLNGFEFLSESRSSNGFWLPLWFGNQYFRDETNPTYGTARVLSAFLATGILFDDHFTGWGERVELGFGIDWLTENQSTDGGWGTGPGTPSSVEETALAVEVLLSDPAESSQVAAKRGLLWLIERVENGTYREPTPIGFYFAKLWYFERLYPLIFTVAALRRACEVLAEDLKVTNGK